MLAEEKRVRVRLVLLGLVVLAIAAFTLLGDASEPREPRPVHAPGGTAPPGAGAADGRQHAAPLVERPADEPTPMWRVAGRVVGADGVPRSGCGVARCVGTTCSVVLVDAAGSTRRALVDDAGTFVFAHAASGPATVRVGGLEPHALQVREGVPTSVEIVVPPWPRVRGRVTSGGVPVAGAYVVATDGDADQGEKHCWRPRRGSRQASIAGHDPEPVAAVTDDAGRYTLTVEDHGPLEITVGAPVGLAGETQAIEVAMGGEAAVDLVLPTTTLEVVARDAVTGEPISDAIVDWTAPSGDRLALPDASLMACFGPPSSLPRIVRTLMTGADGVALLAHVPAGRWTLAVHHPGCFPIEPVTTVLEEGTRSRIEVALERGSAIRGRVLRPNGQPWADEVVVSVEPATTEGWRLHGETWVASERFEVTGLHAGVYDVRVFPARCGEIDVACAVAGQRVWLGAREDVELTLVWPP